jgi:hypothetical protein
MKKKLLQEIKSLSEIDYLYVLGLDYNCKQLKTYLADMK